MRSIILSSAILVAGFALTEPVSADYYLELTQAPGVNVFQVEIWATDSEIGTTVSGAQAQIATSNYAGNIVPGDITYVDVAGLNGFIPAGPGEGTSFEEPLAVSGATIGGYLITAVPTPILQVTYASVGVGNFDAEILPPDELDFESTFVADEFGVAQYALTQVSGMGVNLSAVPEPSPFILVGLISGLGYGCVWLRRRRATAE